MSYMYIIDNTIPIYIYEYMYIYYVHIVYALYVVYVSYVLYVFFWCYMYYIYIYNIMQYYTILYNMPRNSCIPAFLRVLFSFSKGLSQSAPLFGAAFRLRRGSWIPSEGVGHPRFGFRRLRVLHNRFGSSKMG